MNATEIVNQVKFQKGTHVLAIWERPAHVKKGCPFTITKRAAAWVRAGIDYAKLGVVQTAIESGLRGPVEPLPWGQWANFPFIITHKGKDYVRLYPASFANLSTPQVEWTANGAPVEFASIEAYLLASEKITGEKPDCYTLTAEYLKSIGDVPAAG